MPPDDKNSIGNLVNIFTSLNKIKDEPRGVSSHPSVVKDSEDKIKPSLEDVEVSRLKNIADVLGRVWKLGDYAPKSEAGKLEDLTPDKQKSLGISAIGDKVKNVQIKEQKKDWLQSLMNMLGAGAAAVLGWELLPKELKDKIKNKLLEWSEGLGNLITENLPELFNKLGDWIANHIKELGPANIVRLAKPFVTLLDKMFDTIEAAVKGYSRFSKAFKPGTPGDVPSKPDEVYKPSSRGIPPNINKINMLQEGIEGFSKYARPVEEKAPSILKRGLSATKNFVSNNLARARKLLEPVGPFLKRAFSVGKGATKVVKSVLKIPLISELIETGTFLYFKNQQDKLLKEGKISLDQRNLNVGARALNSAGAIIGGLSGATLATALNIGATIASGGLLAPIAGLIQPALAFGGAFVGDILGRKLADSLSSFSPDFAKAVGSNIGDQKATPINVDEMQDFFSRGDGKVYKFSSKDDLLGIKTGGAIDKFLNSQPDNAMTESIISHNKFNKTALIEQIKRQDTMIELLVQLVRKPSGGSVINHASNNNVPSSNFRDAYSSQTLVTN